jgi:hypothetical protein
MNITTQEARALRNADALCFDHRADGTAAIRAIRRENTSTGFEETVTIELDPATSRVQNYGDGDGPWVGFGYVGSPQHSPIAHTLVRHIKSGSRIGFVWTRDNNSPLTRDAGIVVDMLDVKVENGKVCDTFRIITQVGQDNSARLIRRASEIVGVRA